MKRLLLATLAAAAICGPADAQLKVQSRKAYSGATKLEAGQGAILMAFRRPDRMSAGKSGALSFGRYDFEQRDLVFQPKGAKKTGDKTTYWIDVASGDRKAAVEYQLIPVSAGDYVLFGATPGPQKQVLNTFCLGAPAFHVGAGEVVYFGDITPYVIVKTVEGRSVPAMAYSSHPDEANQALAKQPALQQAFRPADLRNEATYGCLGTAMMAYAVPGAATLAAPGAAATEIAVTPIDTGSADGVADAVTANADRALDAAVAAVDNAAASKEAGGAEQPEAAEPSQP
jgi:hypothetical protein